MEAATGLRERKKLRTRDAIVAAALELFGDRGYDATTVEMIAEAAEVSPATVFRHFAAKEEIVFSDRDRRLPVLTAAIEGRPATESDIAAVAAALHDVFADPEAGERARLQHRAIASSVVLRGKAQEILGDWQAAIRRALVACRPVDPADPDGRLRAALLVTALRVAIEDWLGGRPGELVHSIDHTMGALEDVAHQWSTS